MEVRQELKARIRSQELRQRPQEHRFLSIVFSVYFITSSRTTCPGVAPPTVGGALLHQSITAGPPTGPSEGSLFSTEVPSSQITLVSVKLANSKPTHSTIHTQNLPAVQIQIQI